MKNYKLSVSKNGKKYTIVFKAETEKDARNKVHNEGYSILGIEEMSNKEYIGNTFLFTAKTEDGSFKKGKIVGDDIFKVYVKLRKNLEYDVLSLYSEKDNQFSEEKKKSIIKDLNEEYNLLYGGKQKDNLDKLREKIKKDKEDNNKNKKFYLKKELTNTYELIDFILEKLEKLLSGTAGIDIDIEQKEKIKKIYNSIIKLKKSTNISKLKLIGETALIKIGEIELRDIEEKHKETSRQLLKETNGLLRKIGSKESFIEKDKDIGYRIKKVLDKFGIFLNKLKKEKKDDIDKHTHLYVRNMLILKRYKEKLNENTIFIIKNLFKLISDKTLYSDTFIKRKVIKQNIILLKAKEKGVSYSYTFVKKGIDKILKGIIDFIYNIRKYLFLVIYFYIILFIISLNINYYYHIFESNYEGLFYFIVLFFIYIILYLVRNLILMFFSFAFLFIVIIFGVVNF